MHRRRSLSHVAALMALGTSLSGAAQTAPPEHHIKSERPAAGSLIRPEVVRSTAVPINRTYHQLTLEQRAIVHGWYENIASGDEPPFPAEGTKRIHDAVRKAQAKLLVTGELILVATVEATGEVSTVKVIGSPSPEMTQFAASVLLLTKFKPAVCGGLPCKMDFPLAYEFQLR
jgi:hypothetical protein